MASGDACGVQDKSDEAGFRDGCDEKVLNVEAELKSLNGVESKVDSERVLHLLAEFAAKIMKYRDNAGDEAAQEVIHRVQALSDSLEVEEAAAAS